VTINYPSNIQAVQGNNWAQREISMATPIAHKGIQYGAKVVGYGDRFADPLN